MNLSTNIKPISFIKTNAADMLKTVNSTHSPIIITQNGDAKGVLLDPQSYQEMVEALEMLKIIALGEKDITEGKTFANEDVFKDVEDSLK